MAYRQGRNLILKRGASDVIGGVRMMSVKFDATPIDVTNADHDEFVTLMAQAASKQVTIEVSGIADTNFLRSIAVNPATSNLITDLTYTDPGAVPAADILSGDFFMTNYTDSGAHDGPVEFSASFVSSGAWAVA